MRITSESRAILSDGAWVSIGQIGVALGALAGIRLLTEFLEPGIFGSVTLLLGIAALGQNLAITPLTQAVLRFHPESVRMGTIGILRAVSAKILRKVAASFVFVALFIVLLYGAVADQPIWLGTLLVGVFCIDSIRSYEITLLNAARRQRTMAVWLVVDAWIKPLAAIAAIIAFGADLLSVLLGYVVSSAVLLLLFYRKARPEGTAQGGVLASGPGADALRRRLWVYATPLLPIALAGWVSSVGDRYLLAGIVGLAEAGIYAATYALVSRPFFMMAGVLDLTIRPIYHQTLEARGSARAHIVLQHWLMASVFGGGVGFILIWLLDDVIVLLCLAEPYRSGVNLIPWIAGGHWLLAISIVFVRICYAFHHTKAVLWIETGTAVLSIAVLIPAITFFGIVGAAIAVPAYFGAQLCLAVGFASRTYGLLTLGGKDETTEGV